MSNRHRIRSIVAALALCGASPAFAGSLGDVVGTWVAVDSDSPITLLEVSPDTQSRFAVGTVAVSGDCWQCDASLRNVFSLPMNKFAVLPVAVDGGQAEALELLVNDNDTITAILTYRQEPEECILPFNCRWEVVEQFEILFQSH